MSRTICQQHEDLVTTPLPINLGGTGAHTAPQALVNLQLVDRVKIGQANGIAPLNIDGQIPVQFLPPADVHNVSVSGRLIGYGLQTQTFKITDFDFTTTYNLSCTAGVVSRNHDVISFTPPNINGICTISVNGNLYPIAITKTIISNPVVISPIDSAASVTLMPFLVIDDPIIVGFQDILIATHWEVSEDITFATSVMNYDIVTGDRKICPIVTPLEPLTLFYVRAKCEFELLGLSEWSSPISFITAAS